MLRDDGTKTRHVREQRYGNRHVCERRRRARHTRGQRHANRHTRGRRGGTRHTCKRRYRNCPSCGRRPGPGSAALFRGGTICWAKPAPACRKKKGPGKAVSQNSVLRSPQAQSTNDCQRQSNVGRAEETEILSFSGTCAWKMTLSFQCAPGASFPLARNGRHRRFSGAAHAPCGATFAQAIEPCLARNPPCGKRGCLFRQAKAPGSQKGPGGRFISLFYSRAAGEITPRSAGSPRTPCSRGDT